MHEFDDNDVETQADVTQRCGMAVIARHSTVIGRRWRSGSGGHDTMQSSDSDPAREGGQGIGPAEHGGAWRGSVRALLVQHVPRRSGGDALHPSRTAMAPGGAQPAMERCGQSQGTSSDISGNAPHSSGKE